MDEARRRFHQRWERDADQVGWVRHGGVANKVAELLKALDAPNGLLGAAIDVTDPEPLPANHYLWDHPRLIITPHLSGEAENHLAQGTTILLANVERLREGKTHMNNVDWEKGY